MRMLERARELVVDLLLIIGVPLVLAALHPQMWKWITLILSLLLTMGLAVGMSILVGCLLK